jgi:isoquinoline 1-oxidoreductase subunit beta
VRDTLLRNYHSAARRDARQSQQWFRADRDTQDARESLRHHLRNQPQPVYMADNMIDSGTSPDLQASTRRSFLRASVLASGAFMLSARWRLAAAAPTDVTGNAAKQTSIGAWVRIATDNTVTLIVSQAEMGQGISTTLPALLADELGADWSTVKLVTAPFDPAYRNPRLNWMFTGNSESSQSFYDYMRVIGATAREMLVTAAAARWKVPVQTCVTRNGAIIHLPSQRRLTFGEVASAAARIPPPAAPTLRPESELKLVNHALARVDVPPKVDGTAQFGIDFSMPGLLLAAVRTAPQIGGVLGTFDAQSVLQRRGVKAVVPLPNGVAVVADTWWRAKAALLALQPVFSDGPNRTLDQTTLMQQYERALDVGPFVAAVNDGDALAQLAKSASGIVRDYRNPFCAHATMEPMNCTAHVTADRCEVWAPTQGQELATLALQGVLGFKDGQVVVHRSDYLGGGFGRRLLPDFVIQAALISRAVQAPVKVIWDREEDIRRDSYRPATMVRLTAALGEDSRPSALAARVVSPMILPPVSPNLLKMVEDNGVDPSAMEGLAELPYRLAHRRVDFHLLKTPVPTSVMRTTGYGPNIFALESFIDELAAAANQDPLAYRLKLLTHDARATAVLNRVAAAANWNAPRRDGQGRGVAFAFAFGTYIAQVVEVRVVDSDVKVERVTSVVDCGRVLDPGIAAAGIEGGVVFGLAYCKAQVTFSNGAVVEDNLNRYTLPYLAETPQMITEFIAGGGKLGGVGEVSPVTIPPALANAICAATGRRLRAMPLSLHGLQLV